MSTGHKGCRVKQITRFANYPPTSIYISFIFNIYQLSIMAYSTNTPAGLTVQEIIDSLPGLMAVAVVDIQSGMALASHSNTPGLNPETAAAYNTEVVKQKQKAMSALKLQGEKIDDILITLTNQIHLINLTDDGKKFIYLAVNSRDTNLAIARDVCRQSAELLK